MRTLKQPYNFKHLRPVEVQLGGEDGFGSPSFWIAPKSALDRPCFMITNSIDLFNFIPFLNDVRAIFVILKRASICESWFAGLDNNFLLTKNWRRFVVGLTTAKINPFIV